MVAPFPVFHENFGLFQIGQQSGEGGFGRRVIADDQLFENIVGFGVHHRLLFAKLPGTQLFFLIQPGDVITAAFEAVRKRIECLDQNLEFAGFDRRVLKPVGMALLGPPVIGAFDRRKIRGGRYAEYLVKVASHENSPGKWFKRLPIGSKIEYNIYEASEERQRRGKYFKMSDTIKTLPTGSETILIVDDHETIWDFLIEALQQLGYSVLLAENGLDAVEIYEANPKEIDLVLLDMIMPKAGGHQTFYKIRSLDPEAKILLSSGFVSEAEVHDLLQQGACGFLPKPHRLPAVARAIRQVLDTGRIAG